MNVIFERDSVCAGDDVFAPNPTEYSFEQPPILSVLLGQKIVENYLPSVYGAKTYWSAICDGETFAQVEHSSFPHPHATITLLQPDGALPVEKVFFRYEKQETLPV